MATALKWVLVFLDPAWNISTVAWVLWFKVISCQPGGRDHSAVILKGIIISKLKLSSEVASEGKDEVILVVFKIPIFAYIFTCIGIRGISDGQPAAERRPVSKKQENPYVRQKDGARAREKWEQRARSDRSYMAIYNGTR